MRRTRTRIVAGVACAGVAVLALAAAGARVNTSKSIPLGLYWASSAPVDKGVYILFCPPQRSVFDDARDRGYIGAGFCPGGYGYMMKRVVATRDDTVAVADDGVRVNGELLAHSAPIRTDRSGRALPRYRSGRYKLGKSELLPMSDASATSFDARYFGPIERAQIRSVLRPLITW
ncbi:conjugative transfer signal peptidase TraF [Verminephrobacter aporrectodeae subsp. tuberculatae]|uniref:conjugative transfer signal peptidase TraF n=1 Tax=Verminephrobacter aporrectodeae TaxID=1110389 RepID=UPI0022433294|nr:conjugative transfer signal peptidase TraF [Verminephrobacter aporrectodeae]MCW8207880.1 conjugative transfer signal peptidase TraF [Verminephrobacter aporrectodeae subsp. tuberculatae]